MSCIRDLELDALEHLAVPQLREKHLAVFGRPSASSHRRHLIRQVAQGIQVQAEGGLSQRARRRAAALIDPTDVRVTAASEQRSHPSGQRKKGPAAGTTLVRVYRGRPLQVQVLEDGFEYEGQIYRSLTALARAITGSHWNGPLFFGLTPRRRHP